MLSRFNSDFFVLPLLFFFCDTFSTPSLITDQPSCLLQRSSLLVQGSNRITNKKPHPSSKEKSSGNSQLPLSLTIAKQINTTLPSTAQ
ncbi:MAG: hypothetical protein BYD32DRAFT_426649 [Podila humilis]|nr:MAG: hypothetical protein BYD32DRAFT_426649 [Podila humilis]